MGQKVNPNGLRVGVIKNWDSRWFAKDNVFGDLLVEDYEIRKDLKKRLYDAGVPAIEIERKNDEIKIMIQCARPGMVVGRGGEDIKKLEEELTKKYGKKVRCSIIEIKNPDTNATLVAENIAAQLEKRIGFRRAMKQSMGRAMRMGAKGIKVSCGGRLGGAEIARTEHYHEGTIPLQTLRADIDYGFAEADTTYGKLGVKVWINHGEILDKGLKSPVPEEKENRRDGKKKGERRPRRDGERRPRRDDRRNERTEIPKAANKRIRKTPQVEEVQEAQVEEAQVSADTAAEAPAEE